MTKNMKFIFIHICEYSLQIIHIINIHMYILLFIHINKH